MTDEQCQKAIEVGATVYYPDWQGHRPIITNTTIIAARKLHCGDRGFVTANGHIKRAGDLYYDHREAIRAVLFNVAQRMCELESAADTWRKQL